MNTNSNILNCQYIGWCHVLLNASKMLENYLKGKGVGEVVESKEKVKLSQEEYDQE